MRPVGDLDSYEIPPLPQESEFPMEIGEMDFKEGGCAETDMTDVSVQSVSDMENNPVEPPPPEKIIPTGVRKRYSEEDIQTVRKPFKEAKQLDEFYAENNEGFELARIGRKNSFIFCIVFIAMWIVYLAADLNIISGLICLIECASAVLTALGSTAIKRYLSMFCIVNILISILNFSDAFLHLNIMLEKLYEYSFVPDSFTKAVYLAAAVFSAVCAVILIKDKSISEYCRRRSDPIDRLFGFEEDE